jgi:ATP-dependent Lhr-like helicase
MIMIKPLSSFHPAISRWWVERFTDPTTGRISEPTDAQRHGWDAIRAGGHALIAAPTGSGKTLAAFLNALDQLLREGLEDGLPDETRVVYVSPLKALSADIHKNLAEPRREIRRIAEEMGLPPVRLTAAVRTGDTPQAERAAMLRTPPHILVTTPESLYLLLTAERSREMLRTTRTVIVDEIHAVLESRRGAHLALSLERLDHVCGRKLQRIGLSATQKPIQRVAEFLTGTEGNTATATATAVVSDRNITVAPDPGSPDAGSGMRAPARIPEAVPSRSPGRSRTPLSVEIIDQGHLRKIDLSIEVPGSPLESVMAGETWQEVYDRLVGLIQSHRTTLVFVNTRRLAERIAAALSEQLGEDAVTAHHGSLARDVRLDAEERLKTGKLKALVATASLELGIDIGYVDLVCQIGSPRRIAALLQRVGRSGHTVGGTPKGRLFPLTRDDLVECAALLRAIRRGELDRAIIPEKPLDVLAQQITAEAACEDWTEQGLFELMRRAYPYRDLTRPEFDDVVSMLARGFATKRGRRAALVHHDGVNHRIRGRKNARLSAIQSGGAIPEVADFRVVLEPDGTFIGTLNEDFAIESMAGDIFQLGNTSWLILRIESGVVRVADAEGQPPTIPFWLGEAPSRSDELSAEVSELRETVSGWLRDAGRPVGEAEVVRAEVADRLARESGLPASAASQIVDYLAETRRLLGVVPTQRTVVLERFFDEAGGMQLLLHAPFGARVNRAWGLALRKKFCRKFNFELQAAATDDGLLLSLGPQHSFPLEEVFRYLHPETLKDTLVQAVLDSPLFGTRWRWTTTLALAVPRSRNGRKVPPQIQRMQAEDLLAAAFPDAAACFENIEGEREVPDHPLVTQALKDCLEEAMDLPHLEAIVRDILAGNLELVARDTPEPSPIGHELLNARPYAFLDDAPLEERRTQAVYTRRALEPSSARDLGALDPDAIQRVRDEAWPQVEDPDELHDTLLTSGFLLERETTGAWISLFHELCDAGRATRVAPKSTNGKARNALWVAAERLPEALAVVGDAATAPAIVVPPAFDVPWEPHDALRELLRGRLEILGPVTVAALAAPLALDESDVEFALIALETEGVVLRGSFTPGESQREWCDRRLLARIHRYTLNRLRAEIQPVNGADFMRFLFRWQHVEPGRQVAGPEGLAAVLDQLDGFELAAAAWEADVLPARIERYTPELLDQLCLTGRVAWGRISPTNGNSKKPGLVRSSPIALMLRRNTQLWLTPEVRPAVSGAAAQVLEALERRGASFFDELVAHCRMLPTQVEQALGELAAMGAVTSDGFSGLRALLTPSDRRKPLGARARRRRTSIYGVDTAGRWAPLARQKRELPPDEAREACEEYARTLLRRYGVVFRKLLARENNVPPWRELAMVYRRLEARGEIRGGRFVAGMSGEQFALPDAIPLLRAVRKEDQEGLLIAIGAADPLNLVSIVTPEERVPALASNRVLYRDGVPIASVEKGAIRRLGDWGHLDERAIRIALVRRAVAPELRAYLKRPSRVIAGTDSSPPRTPRTLSPIRP